MNIAFAELLSYAEDEQAKWERWFAEHGDAPLKLPYPGDLMPTIGHVMLHAFGNHVWFSERLSGQPTTEWWKDPVDRAAPLFDIGLRGKQGLRAFIHSTTEDGWNRTIELPGRDRPPLVISARKAVANALIHEIRHFAQIALIVRQNGMAPPGDHDVILSRALA